MSEPTPQYGQSDASQRETAARLYLDRTFAHIRDTLGVEVYSRWGYPVEEQMFDLIAVEDDAVEDDDSFEDDAP